MSIQEPIHNYYNQSTNAHYSVQTPMFGHKTSEKHLINMHSGVNERGLDLTNDKLKELVTSVYCDNRVVAYLGLQKSIEME